MCFGPVNLQSKEPPIWQGGFKKPNGARHLCRFAAESSLDAEAA
jgi:hypothetical protein